MLAEIPDNYEKNLGLLKKYHPEVYEIVKNSNVSPVGEIVVSENGLPNLKVDTKGNEYLFFHDINHPDKDGEDFLKIVPENARGTVIFRGMGLGYGPLATLANRQDIQFLIIFERITGIFIQALKAQDLSPVLTDPKVIISLGPDPDVRQVLSRAALSMRLEEISMLTHSPSVTHDGDGYEILGKNIYSIANEFNISSATYKSYGQAFISNRLSFLSMIHHTSLADSLKGRFKNVPVILVAAGPSLDKNIDLISGFKDKAVIISADSALPALLAHGAVPDFVTTIDYKNITYEKIATCASKSHDVSLICSSWVGQKVAKVFPAQNIYWTFTSNPMEVWINKGLGGNLTTPGAGTVAHLSFISAIIMECSPVIFVGQDLAFSDKGEAKDHAADTILKSEDQTAAIFKNKKDLIWVDGNNGGQVPTSRSFANYINQFERMIEGNPNTYINASEGGAYIKGTERMTLKEVLNTICTENLEISDKMKQCNQDSKIGNMDRFLSDIRSVLKTANEMSRLIKKCDKQSSFLKDKLKKMGSSPAKYVSLESLPPKLKKTMTDIDKYHHRLDKKYRFWQLFDEATMNALQSTERMKYETDKLSDIPEKYIEWLLGNLNRLEEVNKVRNGLLDNFVQKLTAVVDHHKNETRLLENIKQSKDFNTKHMMDLAHLYLESGDMAIAGPVLRKIIKHDPDNAEALFHLGRIASLHNEFEASDRFFKTAVEQDKLFEAKVDEFRTVMGNEYLGYASQFWQYDKGSGKRMVLKGLKYCPDHPRLLTEVSAIFKAEMEAADAAFDKEDGPGAGKVIRQWEAVFKEQPELENALPSDLMGKFCKNYGKYFLVLNDLLKAFEMLHKAISFDKENPESHMVLSDIMFRMGKNEQAVSHYQKAIEIDTAFVESYERKIREKAGAEKAKITDLAGKLLQTGDQLYNNRQYKEAIGCYEQGLRLDANNPLFIHNMGAAFKALGNSVQAIFCYKKTIAIDPLFFNAYYNLGVALHEIGNNQEAIQAYERAVELKPDFLNARNNLGIAYSASGQYEKAIEMYQSVLEINARYIDVLNNLGVAYQSVGKLEKAVACFEKFLSVKPDNHQVRTNLNNLLGSDQYQRYNQQ